MTDEIKCVLTWVRHHQAENKVSTDEIAGFLDRHPETVRRILRGDTLLSMTTYLQLSRVVGFDAAGVLSLAMKSTGLGTKETT